MGFTWVIIACLVPRIGAVESPVLRPVMGWSTWTTFKCDINETLVHESIEALASSPLSKVGYEYVLIDDCWTMCLDESGHSQGHKCKQAGPRGADGRIQISPTKFPHGFKNLTAFAHSKGLKIGIYTSVSSVTCGGYTGSLGHEAIDAKAFVEWGFDFVKHDTCGTDYTVHDGGLQNATIRMRDALWKYGQSKVIYYLDSGNPTSPQRVFNPYNRHVSDPEAIAKLATRPSELVWVWLNALDMPEKGPHLFKSWFDITDSFGSTLTNAHNQVRIAEYQWCGHLNMPDMLTVGIGGQTQGQYRAQFFLWAVLGAPLILSNDIRSMSREDVELLSAPEILAVNQDKDCVQGSQARDSGSSETWIKPLSDGTFAVVLLNKGEQAADVRVHFDDDNLDWQEAQDFFPAKFQQAAVRDIFARKEMGIFQHGFTAKVAGNDAMIIRVSPSGNLYSV